jgi:hypothetical protein
VRQDLQRALTPPAESHDVEVPVERERPPDVQTIDQGKAGAIDDAERLIGPFPRDLTTAPQVLRRDADDRDDAPIEASQNAMAALRPR